MTTVPSLIPVKISGLPAATTTSAADMIPIVQDGVTRRATLSLLPSNAASGQFYMDTGSNGTFPLLSSARYAGTIVGLYGLKTASGTITVTIQIGGVTVTGLGAIAVTSVAQNVLATALNTFTASQRLTVVTASNSSALALEFTIGVTRG